MDRKLWLGLSLLLLLGFIVKPSSAQDQAPKVTVQWDKVTRVSQTTPTLQVVVNPPCGAEPPFMTMSFNRSTICRRIMFAMSPGFPIPSLESRSSSLR